MRQNKVGIGDSERVVSNSIKRISCGRKKRSRKNKQQELEKKKTSDSQGCADSEGSATSGSSSAFHCFLAGLAWIFAVLHFNKKNKVSTEYDVIPNSAPKLIKVEPTAENKPIPSVGESSSQDDVLESPAKSGQGNIEKVKINIESPTRDDEKSLTSERSKSIQKKEKQVQAKPQTDCTDLKEKSSIGVVESPSPHSASASTIKNNGQSVTTKKAEDSKQISSEVCFCSFFYKIGSTCPRKITIRYKNLIFFITYLYQIPVKTGNNSEDSRGKTSSSVIGSPASEPLSLDSEQDESVKEDGNDNKLSLEHQAKPEKILDDLQEKASVFVKDLLTSDSLKIKLSAMVEQCMDSGKILSKLPAQEETISDNLNGQSQVNNSDLTKFIKSEEKVQNTLKTSSQVSATCENNGVNEGHEKILSNRVESLASDVSVSDVNSTGEQVLGLKVPVQTESAFECKLTDLQEKNSEFEIDSPISDALFFDGKPEESKDIDTGKKLHSESQARSEKVLDNLQGNTSVSTNDPQTFDSLKMEQDAVIKEIGNGDKIPLKLPAQDESISDNLNEQSQVNNSDLTKFIKSEGKVQDTLKTSSPLPTQGETISDNLNEQSQVNNSDLSKFIKSEEKVQDTLETSSQTGSVLECKLTDLQEKNSESKIGSPISDALFFDDKHEESKDIDAGKKLQSESQARSDKSLDNLQGNTSVSTNDPRTLDSLKMEQDAAIKEIGNGDKIPLKLPTQDETISDNLNEQSRVNNSDLTKSIKSEEKVQDTLETSSLISAAREINGAVEGHENILSDRVESLTSDISVSNLNSTGEQVLGLKLPIQTGDALECKLTDLQEKNSESKIGSPISDALFFDGKHEESKDIDAGKKLHSESQARSEKSLDNLQGNTPVSTNDPQTFDSLKMEQDAVIKEIGNSDRIPLKLPAQDETISDNLNEQSQVNNSDLTKFIKSKEKVQDTLKTSSQVPAACESNGADERHEKIWSDRVESLASDISVCNVNSTEEQVLGLKLPVQIEDKPEHRLADVQEMTSVIVTKPSTSSSISLNRELQESGRKVEETDNQLHCKLDGAKKKVSVYETNSSSFINTKKDQTVGIDSKIIFRDRRLAKVNGNPFQNFPKIYGDYRIKPKVTLLPKVTETLPIPIRRCEVKFDNKLKTLSRQIPFFGDKRVKFQESNSDDDGEEYFAINEDVDSDDSDTQNNDRKIEKLDGPMEENRHDGAESCISNGKEENISLQLEGFCIEGTKFAPKLPPEEEEIMEEIDAGCDEDAIEPSRVKTNRRLKTARRRPMGDFNNTLQVLSREIPHYGGFRKHMDYGIELDENKTDEEDMESIEEFIINGDSDSSIGSKNKYCENISSNELLEEIEEKIDKGCNEDAIEPSRVKTNRRLKTARRRLMGDFNNTLQVLSREIPHYGGFRKPSNYGIELDENKKYDEDMESIEEFIINGDSDSSIGSKNKYCENISSNELLEEIEEKIDKGCNEDAIEPSRVKTNRRLKTARRRPMEDDKLFSNRKVNSSAIKTLLDKEIVLGGKKTNQKQDATIQSATANKSCPSDNKKKGAGKPTKQPKDSTGESTSGKKPMVKFGNGLKTLSRQIPFFGDKRVKFQESNSDEEGEEYFAINEDVDSDDSDTQNDETKIEKLDGSMDENYHDDAGSPISNGKEENLSLQLKGFCIEGTKVAPKLPPEVEEIMEEIVAGCDEDVIEPSRVKTNRRIKTARRRPMGCNEDAIEPSRVKTNRRLKTARRRPMGCIEDANEPSRVKTNRRLKTARRRPMGDSNKTLQVLSGEIPHYGGFRKRGNYRIELDEVKKDDEVMKSIEEFIINGDSDSSIGKESKNKYCENISSNELLEEIEEKIDKGDNKLSSNQKVNSSAIKSLLNRKQKGGKKKNQKRIAPMPSATANKPCPPDNEKKGAEKSTKQPKGSTGKSSGKKPKGTAKSGNLDDTSKKKTTEQPNLAPIKRKGKFKGVLKALSRIIPHQDHSEDNPNAKIRNLLRGNGKRNKKCGTKQLNSNDEMEKNSSYDGMNAVKQEGIVPFVSAGEMQFYDRRIPVENDKMAKMDRKDDNDSSSGDESIIFLTEPPSKKVSRAKKFFRRIRRF
uniref:uncharacterized protein LOC120334504 n=1 Tax=Styela clava TaxID=7725 RepID=UPI00193954DE|nr:uncharacterized protein LOC120334504 [Styela clava]